MADQVDYLAFDDEFVDFAVAVYQEDGRWAAVGLPPQVAESIDGFLGALRQQGSEGGPIIGLVGLGDEYFVAARLAGRQPRLFLSNAAVAADDRIAGDVLDRLALPFDPEEIGEGPVGDQEIFADFGFDSFELAITCEQLLADRELRLVDVVAGIAGRLGFGEQFALAAPTEPGPGDPEF
jgi:putative tRNA adenosine deaminase-associated protein